MSITPEEWHPPNDLADFLLARIAEDEAMVDRHKVDEGRKWMAVEDQDSFNVSVVTYPADPDIWVIAQGVANVSDAEHIAAWHPARILAECNAKRRIVEQYKQALCDAEMPAEWNDGYVTGQEFALKLLLLPYVDHPDCRAEWRP